MTSAFKIARNAGTDFSSHHSLLKPSCLSTFGPPVAAGAPPYGHAPMAPTMPSPLSHDQLGGFHPSMLLNAQLALQVQAAAMAAALGASSASTTPTSSIFSPQSRSTPAGLTPGGHSNGAHSEAIAGTLHSMEKMVAGINGNSSE